MILIICFFDNLHLNYSTNYFLNIPDYFIITLNTIFSSFEVYSRKLYVYEKEFLAEYLKMTWIFLFVLISFTNLVHCETSEIPKLITKLINEWNEIDPGIHDVVLLQMRRNQNPLWKADQLFFDIVKAIPEENGKVLPSLDDQAFQVKQPRKASFVIIVSDMFDLV